MRCVTLALITSVIVSAGFADVSVKGRVVDETNAPVAGASVRVYIHDTGDTVSSNAAGEFELKLPSFGRYLVQASHSQFFPLHDYSVEVQDGHEMLIVMNHHQELFESVKVSENPLEVDLSATTQSKL